jgi:hypothetical protein
MDPDEVRDAIAAAVMEQGQGAEGNAGNIGEMDAGSPAVSDRDLQIAKNAAPPGFMGMPMERGSSFERQIQETARAAQDPFAPRQMPAQAAPMPAPRGPNSPPLPQWVGKFAPPSYPYGRR